MTTKPSTEEINEASEEFNNARDEYFKLGGQTQENQARFRAAIVKLDELRARNNGQYVLATYNE